MLLFFTVILTLFMTVNMLWAKNLSAHRYLLPVFLIATLLVAHLLFLNHIKESLRKVVLAIWILTITTGSFWIYPQRISQGWDATIAHLPYYELRHQAIAYLEDNRIDIKDVASFFPNLSRFTDIDLVEDQRSFVGFNQPHTYALHANVYNVSDENLSLLSDRYQLIKEFKKHRIYIRIYKMIPKSIIK
ncbi:MAG: hypothetical protein GKR88_00965 [Flavobacteriaceae bacterium]|nr:MAG: hypothetical protein GKR88_00965 [Flavobacteriaceae bacterium]